jgi:hypothetical protein
MRWKTLIRSIQLSLFYTRIYRLNMPIELCATVVVQLGNIPLSVLWSITVLGDVVRGCIMHQS